MREPGYGNTLIRSPIISIINIDIKIQDVTESFWDVGCPENETGNILDCAYLALQENNNLIWRDIACG